MFDRSSTFGEALDSPAARSVLEVFLPGIAASPMASQFRGARLGQVVNLVPGLAESVDKDRFFAALAELDEGGAGRAPYAPAIDPHPEYEPESVPRGSAGVALPAADAAVGRRRGALRRARATATPSSTSS